MIRWSFLVGTWLCCSAGWAAPSVDAAEPLLEKIAFSPLVELHVIGVDVDGDKHLRWAAWSENTGAGSSVRLALLRPGKLGAELLGTEDKQDAYEPEIHRIVDWRFGGHPVLALAYRYGAAARQLDLYGIGPGNRLVLLDTKLGEELQWRIGPQGKSVLTVYSKPHGVLTPSCFAWREQSRHLEASSCP